MSKITQDMLMDAMKAAMNVLDKEGPVKNSDPTKNYFIPSSNINDTKKIDDEEGTGKSSETNVKLLTSDLNEVHDKKNIDDKEIIVKYRFDNECPKTSDIAKKYFIPSSNINDTKKIDDEEGTGKSSETNVKLSTSDLNEVHDKKKIDDNEGTGKNSKLITLSQLNQATKVAANLLGQEQSAKSTVCRKKANLDESFCLERFLTNILTEKDMPMSVSFINLYLSQRKLEQITEKFIALKSIQNKFSIYILGCDLKIRLKELDEKASRCSTNEKQYVVELSDIIQKDVNKLQDLKDKFKKDKLLEILYDKFLQKYSSNKYKMKLPFIVRNSHALSIYKKGDNAYVRFISEEEEALQAYNSDDGFDYLLVKCLKNLLSCFTEPLNQGILNACFNYGSVVIDSTFLYRHHDCFSGSGHEGVTLNKKDAEKVGHTKRRHDIWQEEKQNKRIMRFNDNSNQPPLLNLTNDLPSLMDGVMTSDSQSSETLENNVRSMIDRNQSVVIVGNSINVPIMYYDNMKMNDKIASLEKLKEFIDSEIAKIS